MTRERPITFRIKEDTLLGVVHEAATPPSRGVLIIVGGPQYRIGAHRQFVHLARHLASEGVAAMRFDYRGLGDSEGQYTGFEHISEDIDAALAAFREAVPSLDAVTLWGLCDAASAIAMKAEHNECVRGAVLLNPWVRTEEGEARAYLRHYYLQRLLHRDFWRKVLRGRLRAGTAIKGLRDNVASARRTGPDPLPKRVTDGIAALPFPVSLILSGSDLTAREFEDVAETLIGKPPAHLRITRIVAADHTFSRAAWKEEVARVTSRFVSEV